MNNEENLALLPSIKTILEQIRDLLRNSPSWEWQAMQVVLLAMILWRVW